MKTRKLKAKWTVEAAKDLKSIHGIDVEETLIQQIANQIDADIIKSMFGDEASEQYIESLKKKDNIFKQLDNILNKLE